MLGTIAMFVVFGAVGLAVIGIWKPELARKILKMLDNFFKMLLEICEWIGKTTQLIFSKAGMGFTWLTSYPGNLLFLGFGVVYAWFLNAEGYWQIIPSDYDKFSFVPKPFIWDNANIENIPYAFADINFWIAFLFSTLIQVVQSLWVREKGIEEKKKQFEEANRIEVPDLNPKAIKLAEHYQKPIKNHGMKALGLKGILILVCYAIDISVNLMNFPLIEVSPGEFVFNLAWGIFGVVGAELFVNLFNEANKAGKGKA